MKLSIPAGTTSKRIAIFIQDSSSTTGAGLTGLTNASGSLTCYTWIDTDGNVGGTSQALQSATLGTWTTRGFIQKDSTNLPGFYEFGIPDALLAAGVKWAIIMLKGAANMAPLPIEIEVTATSNQDGVHGGLSCLPNTAVTTNASLLTSGTGTDQLSVASGRIDAGKILGTAISTPATAGILDVNVKNMNNVAGTPITTIKAVQGLATDGVVPTVTNLTNAPTAGDLTATMKTSVVTAVGTTLVCTEPTAVPAASPTLIAAISWLLSLSRNKITQTATTQILKADDGSTTVATSTVSDDATTATRGKFA